MQTPTTHYATTSDGVSIAYQIVGSGPPDIVFANAPYISNVELVWEWPPGASLLHGFAQRGRLIVFDRRGTGLSDKVSADRLPTLEARMDDIRAVMDAAGSERAVLAGWEDGAALCFLFAASHPDRTDGVIALQAQSRGSWAPDAPWLLTHDDWEAWFREIGENWGTEEFVKGIVGEIFPTRIDDEEFIRGYWRIVRHSIAKADMVAVDRMWMQTDVRHVLPTIQAPTLVAHTDSIKDVPGAAEEARYIASMIPGASLAEYEETEIDTGFALDAIDTFLESLRTEKARFDRVLATVLFTDIVGSTAKVADIGDRGWRELAERHHAAVRAMLGRYRGVEVSTAGDGFFATFDGPARAVRCAQSIVDAVRPLGIDIRAGVHTGEVETIDGHAGGMGVVIGARIGAMAGPAEVLASSTVKDLTAGSGLMFVDAGEHELKGVPDRWRVYRVVG
jgi:class 3 adenylate cyclase